MFLLFLQKNDSIKEVSKNFLFEKTTQNEKEPKVEKGVQTDIQNIETELVSKL